MKTILRAILISIGNSLPLAYFFSKRRALFYRLAGIDIAKGIFVNGQLLVAAEHAENLVIGAGDLFKWREPFWLPQWRRQNSYRSTLRAWPRLSSGNCQPWAGLGIRHWAWHNYQGNRP